MYEAIDKLQNKGLDAKGCIATFASVGEVVTKLRQFREHNISSPNSSV